MAVPPPDPSSEKAAIRKRLRAARIAFVDSLDSAGRVEALAAVAHNLAPILSREGPISGYVAMAGEVDILPFLFDAFHVGHAIALPHISDDRARMTFRRWHPEAIMRPGLSGIPQIVDDDAVEPAILLTPLAGFDRQGGRLGMGGGYYDRWFAAHPHALRVGIAWSVQEVAALPTESWDMPLHAIVTEKEWITP